MKTLVLWSAGLAAVGAPGLNAWAQPVVTLTVQVSTLDFASHNSEPVVIANPLNSDEVLVAWIGSRSPLPSRINYRVSSTGFLGTLPPYPSILPLPNASGGSSCGPCTLDGAADPVVAASRATPLTGDLYLGALFTKSGSSVNALGIARKRHGESDLEKFPPEAVTPIVRYAAPCASPDYDRPSLAAGPKPPGLPSYGANEALYFTWHKGFMYSNRSLPVSPFGSAWECDNPCNGYPALITSGPPPGPRAAPFPAACHRQSGSGGAFRPSRRSSDRRVVRACYFSDSRERVQHPPARNDVDGRRWRPEFLQPRTVV